MGKWFVSLWDKNQDGNDGWKLTFNNMTVKNNSTSTRYTPVYFGNMSGKNLNKVSLTFNNFQANLNTPLTNDEESVNVIFKGKNVINVSPLANNVTGSILPGADRNIVFARNVFIADNADVTIKASMTGNLTSGMFNGVQDEEHNIIKLDNTNDKNAGSIAVGKNAKLTIDTTGSTTSVRGIASRNVRGIMTLNEGATVKMTLGKGHSSAVLLGNLILDKNSTLDINTMQNNNGYGQRADGNAGADGWLYAPIALGAISFSGTSTSTLKVASGAILKMTRGNVETSTPMIVVGGSTIFAGNNYQVIFEDGSTVDIQDASQNRGLTGLLPTSDSQAYNPLIYVTKSNSEMKIGKVKYLNLQRTNPNSKTSGNLIEANSGIVLDAGKFGGVDIKQWNSGNTSDKPNSTWQVQNFSANSDGTITTVEMAPVDNSQQENFIKNFNILGNEKTSGIFNNKIEKQRVQRLVMTSMDLEAYNYDAHYKDSIAKVGETITIDSPTFVEVKEDGTTSPANPSPDLLENTMSGHPYKLGWAKTGSVTIPQGTTIDYATGKIAFTANQGQVGTVVNIPVTITYKDDSIDQVIAPVYVEGDNSTPIWQKDANGNTIGVVSVHYTADSLPETTDKSAQVANIADNYSLTYQALPTEDNQTITPVDITNAATVTWEKTPSTVVDNASDKTTVAVPVSVKFSAKSTAVKKGYVTVGTQSAVLNLDLTGAQAKSTDLSFSKKSIENGLTQTQFKHLVDTSALDNAGINYTLSWANTPTTNEQNNGTVRVTYPTIMQVNGKNQAYLDVPVQYKVNDTVQTTDDVNVTYPITIVESKKAATITPIFTDNDGKTIDVPAGAKFKINGTASKGATIDKATGVVIIPATNTTGVAEVPVTVIYPDSSTSQATVKSVSIATNDNVTNPASPYDVIKDPSNLPAGTKVTWADDNTPMSGDNVPVKVVVTVPGAEPIEVTGTAHYTDNFLYTPQVKNPVQTAPEQLPNAAAQITNMSELPTGTTAVWQDGQQVPVTSDQTIPGVIIVTYPDGTTYNVQTTITTANLDADTYKPEVSTTVTVKVGDPAPAAETTITNVKDMPEGTSYEWTKTPDTSKVGNPTGEVTVTYPDGTTTTVTVPVTVDGADKTALQKAVDDEPNVEKTPAYQNGGDATKKAYDDAVSAGKDVLDNPDATQTQVDNAAKAIEDAKNNLDGKTDADTYKPEVSTTVTVKVGDPAPAAETTITNVKDMPEGTSYEWTKTPDTSKVGNPTGELPQTGNDANNIVSLVGLGLASFVAMLGLDRKKR